jgi:hypothetical protein
VYAAPSLTLHVGTSWDLFEGPTGDRNQLNPKLGVLWTPLRA